MFSTRLVLSPLLLLASILIVRLAWADTLTVGPDKEFHTPSAAAQAAREGDTVRIEPGVYYDCAIWSQNHLTITGTGPGTVITDTACQGKALFIVSGDDVTISDLTLARARVPDQNGAGIRLEGEGLTLQRVRFLNDEVGLLAGSMNTGAIHISDCEFEDGGRGGVRPTFAVLVGQASLLLIEGSTFNRVKGGQISSAAEGTELRGNQISTGTGPAPAVAVNAVGGSLVMDDNAFDIGPNVPWPPAAVVASGRGPLELRDNRMRNQTGQSLALLFNWTETVPLTEGNKVARADKVVTRSGAWRHRASLFYHRTKDDLHALASFAKHELGTLLRR